jgi:hypothetical protein
MKTDGRKVEPKSLTSMWFGVCVSGWVLFVSLLYSHFTKKGYPSFNNLVLFFIGLLGFGIVNVIYSSNDRYLNVYNKYIALYGDKSRERLALFSFAFLLLPYILIPIVLILR